MFQHVFGTKERIRSKIYIKCYLEKFSNKKTDIISNAIWTSFLTKKNRYYIKCNLEKRPNDDCLFVINQCCLIPTPVHCFTVDDDDDYYDDDADNANDGDDDHYYDDNADNADGDDDYICLSALPPAGEIPP